MACLDARLTTLTIEPATDSSSHPHTHLPVATHSALAAPVVLRRGGALGEHSWMRSGTGWPMSHSSPFVR